jgi:hypothetical protein
VTVGNYSKNMKCVRMAKTRNSKGWLDYPCGSCNACRITRRQEWTFRIMLEMRSHYYNWFVTLTYRDEDLPEGGTLVKEHVQLWMKKIRNHSGAGIRFFAVGEYGDKKGRPHYHVLIFTNDDLEVKYGRTGKSVGVIDSVYHRCWEYGDIVDVCCLLGTGDFRKVAQYVAGYVVKKYNGNQLCEKDNEKKGKYHCGKCIACKIKNGEIYKEFSLMSRKPGIGCGQIKALIKEMEKYDIPDKKMHMVRFEGKLWPVGRTLFSKMQREELTDSEKAIKFNMAAKLEAIKERDNPEYAELKRQHLEQVKARAEKRSVMQKRSRVI